MTGPRPLPLDLACDPVEVAPRLIGLLLVHVKGGRRAVGRIVECEAYRGSGQDSCSHAFSGPTPRNAAMFGAPGRLYVYFTYGMHHCVNVVAHERGAAGAVLLRALEPIEGLDLMRRRRATGETRLLCSGPARLAVAMGLARRDDRRRLDTGSLHLVDDGARPPVRSGVRVGVAGADAGRLWRFGWAGSPWLSRAL